MSKCDINAKSLKLIEKQIAKVVFQYRKNNEPITTLKENVINMVKDIASNYDLAGISEITSTIHNTLQTLRIVDLSSDFFSITNLKNLFTNASLGIENSDKLATSTEQLIDTKQVRLRLDATKAFLDNAYGLARNVRTYAENLANKNIFDACFINRDSSNGWNLGSVNTNAELNRNIRMYQENLLKKITDYLKYITENSTQIEETIKKLLENPKLYNGQNKNTKILDKLSGLISEYLSPTKFTPDILNQLFETSRDNTKSYQERMEAKRRLDAYNANVFLTHFDSYLSSLLGKAVQIKDFNQKTGEDKYQIAKTTANVSKLWRTSENISVEGEADEITKLAIKTTPIYKRGSDTPKDGYYLQFSDFEHIIGKIKGLVIREDVRNLRFDNDFILNNEDVWNSLSNDTQKAIKDKSLSNVINLIRQNPIVYLSSLFEVLSNNAFYETIGISSFLNNKMFTNDELDKMYSMGKGIFDPSSNSSLYALLGSNSIMDYFAHITQTSDSIFPIEFIQYYKDSDGIVRPRTLIDASVHNIRRSVETGINSANSLQLFNNFLEYVTNVYKLTRNPESTFKYIEFTLPLSNHNIRVRVTASSGDVTFTDTRKTVENFSLLWNDDEVRNFVNKILNLGLTSDLQEALKSLLSSYGTVCKDLLKFSSRVILNQYVSDQFLKGLNKQDLESEISSIYGNNAPKYDFQLDLLNLVHGSDIETLKQIAIAKANVSGVTTSSQVKDGAGNGLSAQTLSRLLGSLMSQYDLIESKEDSATRDALIFRTPGLYEGVFTVKEFYDPTDSNKETVNMSTGEMSYAEIVHDFMGGLMEADSNSLVGNGHVLFLPSVNSDKGTIGRIKINLNKPVSINGVTKPIRSLKSPELEALIAQQFGTIYTRIYQAVEDDWKKLDVFIASKGINLPPFDYLDNFASFNAAYMTSGLAEQYGPVDFVKAITLEYNKQHRLDPITLIDLVHFKNAKGFLASDDVLISQIARFNPDFLISKNYDISRFKTQPEFWRLKRGELVKSLLKSKFKANVTGTKQSELLWYKQNYPEWIDKSGNMILAKTVVDGKVLEISLNKDLILLQDRLRLDSVNDVIDWINNQNALTVNPLLTQKLYLDYLFTLEFMCSTVGSFIAHPEKSKSLDALEKEAAKVNAQNKRNVSFTAAMHEFHLNLTDGIPNIYNIAVIDDIVDTQGVASGLVADIKTADGATFVNPFIVILENNSLKGAKAGITKKQFVHFKNGRTGTGGIIKTAGFGLTNDWMINSPFLQRMMKKMTDRIWLNEDGIPAIVDITTGYNGKIAYDNFYYQRGKDIYKIVSINSLGNNQYTRSIQRVAPDGNTIGDIITEEPVIIDTNYKLWKFFGGLTSMSMNLETLERSNASVENVVIAMNNIGTVKNAVVRTQEDIWQPLKHSDIHYVPTAGAVKQGAANINSALKYINDEDYDFQRIYMYQAGIQLDKEHHADDSELSLMTQVISSCAALGYSFESSLKLYQALSQATKNGTISHYEALNKFVETNDNTDLREVLMETIIKSLSTSNSDNFAKTIAKDIIQQAKEGKKIKFSEVSLPLSDNTVYNKIVSAVSVYLTNTGIKQKIPGILSVLTPSHTIYQIYNGRKYESYNVIDEPSQSWTPEMTEFMGLQLTYVEPNILISQKDGKPVAISNRHDGLILIDLALMRQKYDEKAWNNTRNFKPLNRDFDSFEEWMCFALLHEKMHDIYKIQEGESNFDYESRINELALKRLNVNTIEKELTTVQTETAPIYDTTDPNSISNLELGRTYRVTRNVNTNINDVGEYFEYNELFDQAYNTIYLKRLYLLAPTNIKSLITKSLNNSTYLNVNDLIDKIVSTIENIDEREAQAKFLSELVFNPSRSESETELLSLTLLNEAINNPELLSLLANLSQSDVLQLSEYYGFKPFQSSDIRRIASENNIPITSFTSTKLELIRTPKEYQQLRKDIQNGSVTYVAEAFVDDNGKPIGRDLAAYNVRFANEEGEMFQLWDLDSSTALFELNDIKNIKDPEEKQNKLNALKETLGLQNSTLGIEGLEVYIRRKLQRDLMNLSPSNADPITLYDNLLSKGDYTKVILSINIMLGTGNGAVLKLLGQNVTAQNFNQYETQIRDLITRLTQVSINGKLHKINKNSIKKQAFELIMPKTFATNFGLKKFADLNAIKNDRNFFVKQYLENLATSVEENQYTVELKVSSGDHYYLLNKNRVANSNLTKLENVLIDNIDGKTYRLDSNGNVLYEITDDTEFYTDGLGHEVIVTDDIDFYVNNLHYDSIKLSSGLETRPNYLGNLVRSFRDSKKNKVSFYGKYLLSLGDHAKNILSLNRDWHKLTLDNYESFIKIDPITGQYVADHEVIRNGWRKHASFLKSLNVIAARIPAQCLQSVMPMQVVAFDNPDINTAHVSSLLLLLQGSDFDIDSVSIATFDIDSNGLLQLWSPYANIDTEELIEASTLLPFPTGETIKFEESESTPELLIRVRDFIAKYKDLFNINQELTFNPETQELVISPDRLSFDMQIDSVEKLEMLRDFLEEVKGFKTLNSNIHKHLADGLNRVGINVTEQQIPSLFWNIERIVNTHNTYLKDMSSYNLAKINNNYSMQKMYEVVSDPVNLLQAQAPVDVVTEPLKEVAKYSAEAKEAKFRTAGNFVNKIESIAENQVGKKDIAICATGQKTFFGLTQYYNHLLNHGNSDEQQRIILGKNGIMIDGKPYRTLANIRPLDPNTIENELVLNALSETNNDSDLALVNSALLSLSADNAKELILSKLNASTKTIGLYVYGISIGVDFNTLAKIMMSDVGKVINEALDGDVFTGRKGFNNVGELLFKYFDEGPNLLEFNVLRDSRGNLIPSPYLIFAKAFREELNITDHKLSETLVTFGRNNYSISEKINILEGLRKKYTHSQEGIEIYNQLIDTVEDFVQQSHIIGQHKNIYDDIKTLAEGAAEFKIMGQLFGLNQGIKTKTDELIRQIHNIERAIYDKTEKTEDLIDLTRFAFDESYRNICISKYDDVKHSINILDAITKTPHFLGYIQNLAEVAQEVSESYKFRSTRALSLEISEYLKYKDETSIVKGLNSFIGDQMRKNWMKSKDIVFIIPAGNKIFDKNGNMYTSEQATPIRLGTDWGDATFRMWMENEIIPNLKNGAIRPGVYHEGIANNEFIKGLTNNAVTNTVMGNTSVVYTLPINMSPRSDAERAVLNKYKSEFNKLSSSNSVLGIGYRYEYTENLEDGTSKTLLSDPIPLVDLFTYYSMIAHNWKLGEKSLVPILEDHQNSGVIKEFHDFESALDKSNEIMKLDDKSLVLPYVAPKQSPYSAYAQYIKYRNPQTRKYQLMRKINNDDADPVDTGYENPNTVNGYEYISNVDNTNYFQKGSIESNTGLYSFDSSQLGSIEIEYDVDSDQLTKIYHNGISYDGSEFNNLKIMKKVNGVKQVNTLIIEAMLNNKLNPCSP